MADRVQPFPIDQLPAIMRDLVGPGVRANINLDENNVIFVDLLGRQGEVIRLKDNPIEQDLAQRIINYVLEEMPEYISADVRQQLVFQGDLPLTEHIPPLDERALEIATCLEDCPHMCRICWRPFTEIPSQTLCGHNYCFACIRKWARRNAHCPLCQAAVLWRKPDLRGFLHNDGPVFVLIFGGSMAADFKKLGPLFVKYAEKLSRMHKAQQVCVVVETARGADKKLTKWQYIKHAGPADRVIPDRTTSELIAALTLGDALSEAGWSHDGPKEMPEFLHEDERGEENERGRVLIREAIEIFDAVKTEPQSFERLRKVKRDPK